MSVTVHIHKTHRRHTDGNGVVEVNGNTVGECLNQLIRRYPGMKKEVLTAKGKLSSVMEVYINAESAYPNEMAKAVKDGDAIHLTLMLAGG